MERTLKGRAACLTAAALSQGTEEEPLRERPTRRKKSQTRSVGYPDFQALTEALRLQNPNLGLRTAATNHSGRDTQ
jgi:hypothetical protein